MNRKHSNAFTLIEVVVAATLALTLLMLVVVRFNWGSPRQAAIVAARNLGFQISKFRELARDEETLYALQLDIAHGSYRVLQPADRTADALSIAPVKYKATLDVPLAFKQIMLQGKVQSEKVTIFFDARGLLPELSIAISNGQNNDSQSSQVGILLKVDSVLNEIDYVDQ
jgi:type II secretory pathway pseudopilin PulG